MPNGGRTGLETRPTILELALGLVTSQFVQDSEGDLASGLPLELPCRFARGADSNRECVGRQDLCHSFCPFDDAHAAQREIFVETQVQKFVDVAQPVGIKVKYRQPASILLDQGECGTVDEPPFDPEAFRNALRQMGLAGSQISGEGDDAAGFEGRAEFGPQFASCIDAVGLARPIRQR